MSGIDPRIAELIGSYVLGACTPEEADAVRAHMAESDACRREVEALLPVRDALLDVPRPPATPSPSVRDAVLGRVREEATLFAAASDVDPRRERGADADPDRERGSDVDPGRAPGSPVGPGRRRGADDAATRRRARRLGILTSRPGIAALVAVLVALVAVPVALVGGGGPSPAGPVLGEVDRRVAPDGTARIVRDDGTLRLEVDGLPAPRDGRRYQVWRIVDGDPVATTVLFDVDRRGRATTPLPDADGADAFAVTDEPPGGSSAPTGDVVLTAGL
ncbi:MAG: anti-sigma factor [Solirubrobacteraceae bacterium]|nr:anti-sigma factor [Solirubrobacteraceae bacterium]